MRYIKNTIDKYDIQKMFMIIMFSLIFIWIILWLIDPLGLQLNVFFLKTDNFFADFFNVMIYVSDNDIYHNTINGLGQKIYFPLTYMFMDIFSGFEDFSVLDLYNCYSKPHAMMACLIFTYLSITVYLYSLNKLVKLNSTQTLIIAFSSVFLFTIERGNPIMIAAAFSFFFLAYKDHKNFIIRRFALLCLCLAVVLKGYPVLFGLYLLYEKKYKDILICTVFTSLLVILPFLYFEHGFANIPQLISNVQEHNNAYQTSIYPRYGMVVFTQIFKPLFGNEIYILSFYVAKYIMYIMAIISVLLFFKIKTEWKRLALLSLIIASIPSDNGFYCGIYIIPALILFLNNNDGRKIDYVYMLLFCVFLNPIQMEFKGYAISWMFSNLALLVMWLLLIIDSYQILQKKIILLN